MGKRGPQPTPIAELEARGSWLAPARKKKTPQDIAPRIASKARISTEAEILAGIPGYDPRANAGDCRFDYTAAVKVIQFFHERLTLVTGQEPGTPFDLQPWQQSVIGNLFGWKRKDGTRRYREVFVYVAKKNGKSEFAAGLLLYIMRTEARTGIQCFSAAATRDQATVIFNPAVAMIRGDADLSDSITIYGGTPGAMNKALVSTENPLSTFKCMAHDANTGDGVNPHLNCIDEVHRFKDGELISVLVKSTATRKEPITLYTTTADYDRESPCNSLLKRARAVRDNGGDKNRPGYEQGFLPVIYECGKDDDWRNPETWRKANPSLGVTVTEDFIATECAKAIADPSSLNQFLRLHLNIVTQTDVAWLDMEEWDACGQEPVDEESLLGMDCWVGVDLSSTEDFTAYVLVFPVGDRYVLLPRLFLPAASAHKRELEDRVPYQAWARQGYMTITEGERIDYEQIKAFIAADRERFNVREFVYDRWMAEAMIQYLAAQGFTVVPFGQGYQSFNVPTRAFGLAVSQGKIVHGGNPVLRWMAGNTNLIYDHKSMVETFKPVKKDRRSRIDGIVASIMGMARAQLGATQSGWDGTVDFL